MRTLTGFLAISLWVVAQTPAATITKNSLSAGEIDEAIAQLSKITGLEPLKKVQADTITRAGVRKFLEEKIREEIKPEEIRIEELALKRFGLLPAEFDLKSATVDLITEQAAAFYDFRTKKLYLLDGDEVKLPGTGEEFGKAAQKMIVVHELAHALADQHFDLGKYIRRSRSGDSSTARMAVTEGQATWLMMESMLSGVGQSMKSMPGMIDTIGNTAADAMAGQYPVLASAPLYLRTSLIFPYSQGLRFQQAVTLKLGNAGFTQVFKQPPVSSQQILHPEKYFARVEPVKVALPDTPKRWKTINESTVGELEHAVLLEQYLSKKDADELAPAWKGGVLGLAEARDSKDVAMTYASEWESPEMARRFFEAYRAVLKGKWKRFEVARSDKDSFSGTGDTGAFSVQLTGTRVTSMEGFE
ncbi:MAG: hypothetical protein H7039_06670 [Bryobacteraceae bacterium]|nr:hypothetical protein [Bryobacteraceae bacterium]